MANAIFTSNAAFTARRARKSVSAEIARKAVGLFRRWQNRRRQRAELAMLSDVELVELSISRADVGNGSGGSFWNGRGA
jgi:uncharacterized protein YjiS (DUF1127 family)